MQKIRVNTLFYSALTKFNSQVELLEPKKEGIFIFIKDKKYIIIFVGDNL